MATSQRGWVLLAALLLASATIATGADQPSEAEADPPASRAVDPNWSEGQIGAQSCCGCVTDDCHGCGCDDPWSFSFTQTVDYVTNLALPFTLTPFNGSVFRDDFQFQTLFGAQYTRQIDSETSFGARYNYYLNLHPEVEQLDLQSHSALLQFARQVNDRTVATLDYTYAYWWLHNESFVSQNQIGGSLLYRMTDIVDWKIGYQYLIADYPILPTLDSRNHVPKLELIRYFDTVDRNDYLTAGVGYINSDADLSGFSYNAYSAFLGGHWRYGECDQHELTLLYLYAFYDFVGPDPVEPAVIRRDNLNQFTARYGRYLNDNLQVFGQYILFDSESNVVRQEYLSHTVSLGITGTW